MTRSKKSKSDEWETPTELFKSICKMTGVRPMIDVAANRKNTKCSIFLQDGLKQQWTIGDREPEIVPVWCNAPGSGVCFYK